MHAPHALIHAPHARAPAHRETPHIENRTPRTSRVLYPDRLASLAAARAAPLAWPPASILRLFAVRVMGMAPVPGRLRIPSTSRALTTTTMRAARTYVVREREREAPSKTSTATPGASKTRAPENFSGATGKRGPRSRAVDATEDYGRHSLRPGRRLITGVRPNRLFPANCGRIDARGSGPHLRGHVSRGLFSSLPGIRSRRGFHAVRALRRLRLARQEGVIGRAAADGRSPFRCLPAWVG